MLKLVILTVVLVAVVLAAPRPDEVVYTSRLDGIKVEEVIANDRLFDGFVKCFLETGKCTPDGKNLKDQLTKLMPEILETNCAKCTEDHKTKARKILKHLRDNKREDFDKLMDKFDHDKELRKKYKEKYSGLAKDEGFGEIFEL